MRGWRKAILSGFLVAVVFGGAGGAAFWLYSTRPMPPRSAKPTPPPVVRAVTLRARDAVDVVIGYASARSDHRAVLAAEVNGPVVAIGDTLAEGSPVREGQELIRIDDREHRQRLAQAESLAEVDRAGLARLEVERQNLERLLAIAEREHKLNADERQRIANLFEQGLAPKKEFDDADLVYQRSRRTLQTEHNALALIGPRRIELEASHRARLAAVALARLDVERCRIVAPFDGQIERLDVEVGVKIRPGTVVCTIVDPMTIEVPVELPASARPRVTVGGTCALSMDSMPGVQWRGTIDRIAPVADERSRTFAAYVLVDNRRQPVPLMPGYFVRAEVSGALLADALMIPRGAIVENHVFVINDDRAHRREVRIDRFWREQALVSSGVTAGDEVIVSNLDVLFDGAPVRVDRSASAEGGLAGGKP